MDTSTGASATASAICYANADDDNDNDNDKDIDMSCSTAISSAAEQECVIIDEPAPPTDNTEPSKPGINQYVHTYVFLESEYNKCQSAARAAVRKFTADNSHSHGLPELLQTVYTAMHNRLPANLGSILADYRAGVLERQIVNNCSSSSSPSSSAPSEYALLAAPQSTLTSLNQTCNEQLYGLVSTSGTCAFDGPLHASVVATPMHCGKCHAELICTHPFAICDGAPVNSCPNCGAHVLCSPGQPEDQSLEEQQSEVKEQCAIKRRCQYISIHQSELTQISRLNQTCRRESVRLVVPSELDNIFSNGQSHSFRVSGILIPSGRTEQLVHKKRGPVGTVATLFQFALFVLDAVVADNSATNSRLPMELSAYSAASLVNGSANDRLWALVQGFMPEISGRCIEKLLCLLVCASTADSIVNQASDNTATTGSALNSSTYDIGICRTALHVLLLGDAGVGKTRLIDRVSRLCPNAEYLQARHSTKAGLASSSKRSAGMAPASINVGALSRCDRGVLCVDELAELPKLREQLAYAMDNQMSAGAKAGLYTALPARVAILAACNPQTKTHSYDGSLGLKENMGKVADWMHAFDIILVMTDDRRNAGASASTSTIIVDQIGGRTLTPLPNGTTATSRKRCPCVAYIPEESSVLHDALSTPPSQLSGSRKRPCTTDEIRQLLVNMRCPKSAAQKQRSVNIVNSMSADTKRALTELYIKLMANAIIRDARMNSPNLLATLLRLSLALARLLEDAAITTFHLKICGHLLVYAARMANRQQLLHKRDTFHGGQKQAMDRFMAKLAAIDSDTDESALHKLAMGMGMTAQEATGALAQLSEQCLLLQTASGIHINLGSSQKHSGTTNTNDSMDIE